MCVCWWCNLPFKWHFAAQTSYWLSVPCKLIQCWPWKWHFAKSSYLCSICLSHGTLPNLPIKWHFAQSAYPMALCPICLSSGTLPICLSNGTLSKLPAGCICHATWFNIVCMRGASANIVRSNILGRVVEKFMQCSSKPCLVCFFYVGQSSNDWSLGLPGLHWPRSVIVNLCILTMYIYIDSIHNIQGPLNSYNSNLSSLSCTCLRWPCMSGNAGLPMV